MWNNYKGVLIYLREYIGARVYIFALE